MAAEGEHEMDTSAIYEDFEAALSLFYKRLFPFKLMHQWLGYNGVYGEDLFSRREFSCTLADDVYIRHLSFADHDAWGQYVIKAQPRKIDIGAVYSFPPRDRAQYAAKNVPVQKELVFDIDMDDYASVRTCCEGKTICKKCWAFMATAIKVIRHALTEYFGFHHMLFIFSGRRGVHCWVADQRARELQDRERRALLDFMSIQLGAGNRANISRYPHPALEEMRDAIILPMFEDHIVDEQGVMDNPERWAKVLEFIQDSEMKEALEAHWTKGGEESSTTRWDTLKATVRKEKKKGSKGGSKYSNDAISSIAFTYCYPRFDAHVSTALNHLLKSPFCVHPSTGKVCVPIDPDECDEFDPDGVPTLPQLLGEIDAYHKDDPDAPDIKDYKKTSLLPYINYFKKSFLQPLEQRQRMDLRKKEEGSMSF